MSTVLTAEMRPATGKNAVRKIRAAGRCPAVCYGPGAAGVALQIDPKGFVKLVHTAGENALIDLQVVDGAGQAVDTKKVIVREIQYHPFKALPTHVDFYVVSLDRTIEVKVPLELAGVPAPIAQRSATLTQQVHELHVECLPGNIPAKITADISGLQIGGSLHVRDLVVPEGVTILDGPDATLASVVPIHAEVEAPVTPQLEAAEPEVIRERKPAAGAEG